MNKHDFRKSDFIAIAGVLMFGYISILRCVIHINRDG